MTDQISLENAKRLWELGVKPCWQVCELNDLLFLQVLDSDVVYPLDYLLDEVEKRGAFWKLEFSIEYKSGKREYEFGYELEDGPEDFILADNKTDAVALALIEILRTCNKDDE